MKDKSRSETGDVNLPPRIDKDQKITPPPAPKPESTPRKKPGPSVDIGPGPGADVIATPPNRI